jgi:hypothetical protein
MMHEFCFKHQVLRPAGDECGRCASEAGQAERRDTINMHEARIADLEQRLLRTNRVVVELVKRIQRDQKAHNALARASEQLITRVEQALAHLSPNPNLLP